MLSKLFVIVLAASVCLVSCKPETGPPPEPTPAPTVAPEPSPTADPGPEPTPCKAIPPSPGIYAGDCEVTDVCKDNGNGTYSGQCHTRTS